MSELIGNLKTPSLIQFRRVFTSPHTQVDFSFRRTITFHCSLLTLQTLINNVDNPILYTLKKKRSNSNNNMANKK